MSDGLGHGNTMMLRRSYLPICASCSKIRNPDGAWMRSPLAFRRPADVRLTHGYCPDCAREFERQLDRVLCSPGGGEALPSGLEATIVKVTAGEHSSAGLISRDTRSPLPRWNEV